MQDLMRKRQNHPLNMWMNGEVVEGKSVTFDMGIKFVGLLFFFFTISIGTSKSII